MILILYKFTNIFNKYMLILHKVTVILNLCHFNSLFFETLFTKLKVIIIVEK